MKLLALLEDPAGPSARLRFEPHARWLEERGHAITRRALGRSGPSRWRELAAAAAFDAVFVQRRLLQPWESALLRARARRLVVDVDDAIWRREAPPHESWTRRLRARALLRRADVVLAGSRTLVAELATIGVAATYLPTPAARVSPPLDSPAASRAHPPTLLWIGQPSTWRYARDHAGLALAWSRTRAARNDARLLVLGSGVSREPSLPGAHFRDWSEPAEAAALAESDVGLAPLPDDPWTRGKCGARLLGYLAAGLPAIASPVGAQRELAEEIGGVRLATDSEGFAAAALELMADPGCRQELARTAVLALTRLRSVAVVTPALLESLLGDAFPGARTGSRVARHGEGR